MKRTNVKTTKIPNSRGSVYNLASTRLKPWVAMLSQGYDKEEKSSKSYWLLS